MNIMIIKIKIKIILIKAINDQVQKLVVTKYFQQYIITKALSLY